ncbi:MAG: hypothetical protein EBX37_17870, partial [Alphaproteobacteria bacterium]|nr:hypothetical protein [Alphaproteobacteria bacterium]
MADITFITGYFRLPNSSFNDDIEKSRATLSICHPMIIFCDPDTYPIIKAERGKYGYLTHYIVKRFEELELYKYIEQIRANRVINPRADIGNTAEYQIATCSKFTFVRDAINKAIFGTTYYAWIDFALDYSISENNGRSFNDTIREITKFCVGSHARGHDKRIRMCMINYTSKKDT